MNLTEAAAPPASRRRCRRGEGTQQGRGMGGGITAKASSSGGWATHTCDRLQVSQLLPHQSRNPGPARSPRPRHPSPTCSRGHEGRQARKWFAAMSAACRHTEGRQSRGEGDKGTGVEHLSTVHALQARRFSHRALLPVRCRAGLQPAQQLHARSDPNALACLELSSASSSPQMCGGTKFPCELS